MGKKRKIKDKAKAKLRQLVGPPEVPPSATDERAGVGLVAPSYPEDAQAMQRTPRAARRKRSPIKKKTIRAMHLEVNRRIAAVGEDGLTLLDPDVPDHEKYVTLGRQAGNIGDTLTGPDPAPELVRNELVRVMAVAGLWAQSLAGKRAKR